MDMTRDVPLSIQERELDPQPTAEGPPPSCCRTDAAGLTAAYRDHHAAVTAVARRVCGPGHAADVAQDVFVALWRHPERFDPERGSLRSFLLAVAHNKAVDVVRSESARGAREQRDRAAEALNPAGVDDKLLRDDAAAWVGAALAVLPATEREAITAAFYDGYSYRQVAARLGVPEGTIKSRIRSGLRRLHLLLADLDVNPGTGTGLIAADGAVSVDAPARWFAPPSPAELDLLDLAEGPVLDIGCGPGRHVLALARAGVDAVGIDVSPGMVDLAHRRGAAVLHGSIFDALPDPGRWGTCLLLDGNIGIGARPEALLARTRGLVRTGGSILVEAAAPGARPRPRNLRLTIDGSIGPSFSWIDVSIDRLADLANTVSLNLKQRWSSEGRWFAWLTA